MRIGSDLSGVDLTAYSSLLQAFDRMDHSATRLATMQRVNTGKDDPAGLIAIGELQAELTATKAASYSAARAEGMVRVTDSALAEVGELLGEIRANCVSAAGGTLSDSEVAAKQIEVDAALEAIDRIGSSTTFGGQKLLQGGTLTFAFSPDVADTSSLTLPVVHTSSLGGPDAAIAELASGGSLCLSSGNPEAAVEVLDAAATEVLHARANAGAFEKYTIESSQAVLGSMEVNLSSAISQILDADVATEVSRLIQSQILVDTTISALKITGHGRSLIGSLFHSL